MTTITDKGKSLGEKLNDAYDQVNKTKSVWAVMGARGQAHLERVALAFVASLSDQVPCECGADDQCEMAARAEAAETRALAMEEALKRIAAQYCPDQGADVDLYECHKIAEAALSSTEAQS